MSARDHISPTTRPNFTSLSARCHGRGSVLWRRCTLCTSGFVDDDMWLDAVTAALLTAASGMLTPALLRGVGCAKTRRVLRVIVLSHWPHVATHVATQVAQLVARHVFQWNRSHWRHVAT